MLYPMIQRHTLIPLQGDLPQHVRNIKFCYLVHLVTILELIFVDTANASSSHNNKQQPSSTASSPMSITTETVKRTVKSDEVDFESTGQGPRDKTIELMYASIGLGSFAGRCSFDKSKCENLITWFTTRAQKKASDLLLKRAIAIENNMYEIFSSVNEEYKSKARSMVSNLKNKSNQSLRDGVVTGEISVDTLCTMSAEVQYISKKTQYSSFLTQGVVY